MRRSARRKAFACSGQLLVVCEACYSLGRSEQYLRQVVLTLPDRQLLVFHLREICSFLETAAARAREAEASSRGR